MRAEGLACLGPGSGSRSPGRGLRLRQSVPGHTEDEARAVLGEVGLRLVEPGLHRHGAFLPMQAALHRVGDVHLEVSLLTARVGQTGRAPVSGSHRVLWFPWQPPGPCHLPGSCRVAFFPGELRGWRGRRRGEESAALSCVSWAEGNPACPWTREAGVAEPFATGTGWTESSGLLVSQERVSGLRIMTIILTAIRETRGPTAPQGNICLKST